MLKLFFPLRPALELAEHAAAAKAGFAWLVLTVYDDTSYVRSLQRGDQS